jgi:hypothetical protein
LDLVDLEKRIKSLPGVLGCALFTNPDGTVSEIQAFTRSGTDREATHQSILAEFAKGGGASPHPKKIHVFELEAESLFGDRESLERAAEVAEQEARMHGPQEAGADDAHVAALSIRTRPPLRRVVLTSTDWTTEAEVILGAERDEVIGHATGEKTPHGLRVLARATLEAVTRLVSELNFDLQGASLVNVMGHEAVLVLVQLEEGSETIGAALVREGPVAEAAVRATLDAVNRRLTHVT